MTGKEVKQQLLVQREEDVWYFVFCTVTMLEVDVLVGLFILYSCHVTRWQ